MCARMTEFRPGQQIFEGQGWSHRKFRSFLCLPESTILLREKGQDTEKNTVESSGFCFVSLGEGSADGI